MLGEKKGRQESRPRPGEKAAEIREGRQRKQGGEAEPETGAVGAVAQWWHGRLRRPETREGCAAGSETPLEAETTGG